MVETERKYVQDLEIMQVRYPFDASNHIHSLERQQYSTALSQSNVMNQDTIHLLFPNLNKLLNFQRKFLIRFESTAELPWREQRWGQHFLESVSLNPAIPLSSSFFSLSLFGTIGGGICCV
jgi:cell division control protein 24